MSLHQSFARWCLIAIIAGPLALGGRERTPTADGGRQGPPAPEARADAGDAHDADTHAGDAPVGVPSMPAGEPRNPVQAEMRLLNEATRDWVTAIAQNDLASIPPGISRVHAARLVTEKALTAGTYAPPKGGAAALPAFVRQDDAFHDELVTLLQAAKANDFARRDPAAGCRAPGVHELPPDVPLLSGCARRAPRARRRHPSAARIAPSSTSASMRTT